MNVTHHFFLPLTPKATQRSRCTCRGRFAQVYTEPKYKEWRAEAVAKLLEVAATEDFRPYREQLIRIETEVVVTRPRTSKKPAPTGDIDNYEKGLWDAITATGKWWADDKQIVDNHTSKRWARDGEDEGYYVTIEFL